MKRLLAAFCFIQAFLVCAQFNPKAGARRSFVLGNAAPVVAITAPTESQVFDLGSTVDMRFNALDADGTVTSVVIFLNHTAVSTNIGPQYSYVRNDLPAGSYRLDAVVTDNKDESSSAYPINFTVRSPNNVLPTVTLDSPASGAQYSVGSTAAFIATPADADGTISRVDFYIGTLLVQSKTTSPWSFNWIGPPGTNFTATVRAFDNSGGGATSSPPVLVSFTNNPPILTNQAPVVSISSPANGSVYVAPATVGVSIEATDSDGTISKVDLFINDALHVSLTTAPYTTTVSNFNAGTWRLRAIAYDNSGTNTQTGTTTITVNAPPPPPPGPPGNFAATGGNATVSLSWNAVAGASGYSLSKSVSGGELSTLTNLTAVTFTDTAVTNGITYIYTVASMNAQGTGIPSAPVSVQPFAPVQETSIPRGSTWKFLDTDTDLGAASSWAAVAFDDSLWLSGPGPLGYPIGTNPGEVQTLISYGRSSALRNTTTYLRKTISIPDKTVFTNLTINAIVDDGIVFYVNGTEVYRRNVAAGQNYHTLATAAIQDSEKWLWSGTNFSNALLVNGNNTFAAELHSRWNSATDIDSDLLFDVELIGSSTNSPSAPTAPSGLTATKSGQTVINLAWVDNANNETGFDVDRSTDDATWANISTVAANVLAFSDTGLAPASLRYYRVRARNATGASAYTTSANATTDPVPPQYLPPPTGLAATAGNATVALTWNAVTGADRYPITRGISAGGTYYALASPTAANLTDNDVTNGITYYYKAASSNSVGIGTYSGYVSATPSAGVTPPTAPSGFTATAGSSGIINLSWTDNSSDESGFKIESAGVGNSPISGTEYFVSPTGSASNNGLSTSAPWTLSKALTDAGNGNTITLMDGAYTSAGWQITGNNQLIRALNKWGAVFTNCTSYPLFTATGAHHITWDGLAFRRNRYQPYIYYSNNDCTVRNCWFSETGVGFAVSQSASGLLAQGLNLLIENCLSEGAYLGTGTGGYNHGFYVGGTNITVRNCVSRMNDGYGISVFNSDAADHQPNDRVYVYNNLCYSNLVNGDNGGHGAQVGFNSTGGTGTNYIFGNTIISQSGNFALQLSGGAAICITNNILISLGGGIERNDSVAIRANYNLSRSALAFPGANDVIAVPGFVSTNNGAYWLTSGSAARNVALSTQPPPVSFFGVAASSVADIGAFQYDALLAVDTRNLSVTTGADYWNPAFVTGLSFSQIATTGAGVTTFANVGLPAQTTRYYRVRAYNSAGNSAYTATASATTIPVQSVSGFWAVPTGGVASGNGEKSNPWTIAYALSGPPPLVNAANRVVNIEGGTHSVPALGYNITLKGTASNPYLFQGVNRAFSTGRTIFQRNNGDNGARPTFMLADPSGGNGATYVYLQDLDIVNIGPRSATPGDPSYALDKTEQEFSRPGAVNDNVGNHNKTINLVIGNHGTGITVQNNSNSSGHESSGCLVYHTGWDDVAQGRAHSTYDQNASADGFDLNGFISWAPWGQAGQMSGSSTSHADHIRVRKGIFVQGGMASFRNDHSRNLLIGFAAPINDILVEDSTFYYEPTRDAASLNLAYDDPGKPNNTSLIARRNLVVGRLYFGNWAGATITDNDIFHSSGFTIHHRNDGVNSGHIVNGNRIAPGDRFGLNGSTLSTAAWRALGYDTTSTISASIPSANVVKLFTTDYDPGVAHIAVFNPSGAATAVVNLGSFATAGEHLEIRSGTDVYTVFVDVPSYNGSTVTIPMSGWNILTPVCVLGQTGQKPATLAPYFFFGIINKYKPDA